MHDPEPDGVRRPGHPQCDRLDVSIPCAQGDRDYRYQAAAPAHRGDRSLVEVTGEEIRRQGGQPLRAAVDNGGMRFRELLQGVVGLLFVPHCPACDRRTAAEVPLCGACTLSLVELGAACPRCAEPHAGPAAVLCRRCCIRPLPLARITAPYRYGGELAVALRRLKFDRRADIGRALAPLIAPTLAAAAAGCDVAMPVPLHRRRLASRGFNQSDVLLRHALAAELPIDVLSLRRRRATRPQSGLDARGRAGNVRGAFEVRGPLTGRRILLVDDVVTTGATMAEAARALLRAGAKEVIGVCAARAES